MKACCKGLCHKIVIVAAAAFLLAGCGGGGPVGVADAGPAGEWDPDAVLEVGFAGGAKTLDPYLQDTLGGTAFLTVLYDRLITVDSEGNLVPGLAEAWSFATDGTYLDLSLRKDVTFNDGAPFDAAAVAANIERGKTLAGSVAAPVFRNISAVSAVDDHTARLHLVPGTGVELPGAFTTNLGMMISPKVIAEGVDVRNGAAGAGSGAYVVSEFVPSESLTVTRSSRTYWDPEGGKLAGLEITTIPEASTRMNGVQTGALDLTWVSSASESVQAQENAARGAFNVDKVPFRSVLGINVRARGDMADPELRQALAYAIDPDEINALFSGNCAPFRQMYPAASWANDPSLDYPYSFDPEKAARLVAKGGGAHLTLTFGAGSNTEKPANVIQSQLSEAGFDVELNAVPVTQVEPRYMAGDFDASVSNAFVPKADPAETVTHFVLGSYGHSNGNPQIEELAVRAANPTLSQEERAPMYSQIWDLTLKEAMFVPICNQTNVTVFTNKVVGANEIPWVDLGTFDLRHVGMRK